MKVITEGREGGKMKERKERRKMWVPEIECRGVAARKKFFPLNYYVVRLTFFSLRKMNIARLPPPFPDSTRNKEYKRPKANNRHSGRAG